MKHYTVVFTNNLSKVAFTLLANNEKDAIKRAINQDLTEQFHQVEAMLNLDTRLVKLESLFEEVHTNKDGSQWSRICKNCVAEHGIEHHMLDDVGSGRCMVRGCFNDADYFIDFE
jgi:hypothetical protein